MNTQNFRKWLKKSEGLRPKTVEKYIYTFERFIRLCGGDLEDARAVNNRLGVLNAPKSFKHDVSAILKKHYKFIGQKEKAVHIDSPRIKQKSVKNWFTQKNLDSMVKACTSLHDMVMLRLLFDTACRVSEFFSIRPNMIDFDENEIVVEGKGGKTRIVTFGDRTKNLLEQHIKNIPSNKPLFNINTTQKLRTRLRQIAKRSGQMGMATWLSPHRFRHSCAIHLRREGTELDDLQDYLGHDNINVTMKFYKRFKGKKTRRKIKRILK